MKKLLLLIVLLAAIGAAAYFLQPADSTLSLAGFLVSQGQSKEDSARFDVADHYHVWIDAKDKTGKLEAVCVFGRWIKIGDMKPAGEAPTATAK